MKKKIMDESLHGITIDRVIRSYNYNMPTKHFHDEYELYYLVEGERYYFIEDKSYHIHKGTLVLINKGIFHKTTFVNSNYHDRILIELKEEPFSSFFSSMGDLNLQDFFHDYTGVITLDEVGQNFVKSHLMGIAHEIKQKQIGYEMATMIKLTNFLLYLMRYVPKTIEYDSSNASSNKQKKVDEVASYIIENFSQKISLETIAKSFYMNKSYLSRIFGEITGFTVNEYINLHRIQKAQELLLHTTNNITEITEFIGFESISYFVKVFKKYTETTPLKYRKDNKKSSPAIRKKKEEI